MTRLFREGRTETVRSCSNESCAFVLALDVGEVKVLIRPSTVQETFEKETYASAD